MVHRRRRIRRFGRRRLTGRQAAAALVCGVLLAVAVHHAGGTAAGQARASTVATRGGRHGDRLRPGTARQAVRVGRHRARTPSTARAW